MSLSISKKLKTYQFLFIFLLVFVFTTVLNKKSFGEKFFLINPSPQCQAYLEIFYSDILEIKDGLFVINDIENKNIKIIRNGYKNYDYHIIFKSDNSSMIISKSDSYQTGTLTIFNKINPCRSIVTKDNLYASKFSSDTLKSSDLDQDNNSQEINDETTIAKDENSNVEQLVLERD